jgi:hypothetical protein
MSKYVLIDTDTKRVRGFVDGDIQSLVLPSIQEAIEISEVPTLEKQINFYKFENNEYQYVQEFEDEVYRRRWKRMRKEDYPSITDYIDGVVKGDQEQINNYIAACLAVKAKYPKPE